MTLLQAAVLGVVQGLSEFLPISSSAHLILVRQFAGWEDPGIAFDVALHWGTLIGVFLYFWKQILNLTTGFIGALSGQREFKNRLPLYLIIGCIVPGIVGLLLEHKVENSFRSPWIIAGMLALIALLMWKADQLRTSGIDLEQIFWVQALLIGSSQALALIPGVSRSGISICIALFLGFSRVAAVEFSFLLSIPLILGAGLTKIKYLILGIHDPILLTGVACSALAGYAAIFFLMNYIKTKNFTPFIIYRLMLAAGVAIWLLSHAPL